MSSRADRAAAEVFSALGDETRLTLVRKLGEGAPLTATSLASGARVTRQAIVKHLKVLEGAGLVTAEKQGREVLYGIAPRRIESARAYLDVMSARWDRALAQLARAVEDDERSPSVPADGSPRGRERARPHR